MDQIEVTNYANGQLPYCWRVKRLLKRKKYPFEAVDLTHFRHEVKATTR